MLASHTAALSIHILVPVTIGVVLTAFVHCRYNKISLLFYNHKKYYPRGNFTLYDGIVMRETQPATSGPYAVTANHHQGRLSTIQLGTGYVMFSVSALCWIYCIYNIRLTLLAHPLGSRCGLLESSFRTSNAAH